MHPVLREFRAVLNSYEAVRPRYSVGKIHILDWKEWASYYGKNLDELHMQVQLCSATHALGGRSASRRGKWA